MIQVLPLVWVSPNLTGVGKVICYFPCCDKKKNILFLDSPVPNENVSLLVGGQHFSCRNCMSSLELLQGQVACQNNKPRSTVVLCKIQTAGVCVSQDFSPVLLFDIFTTQRKLCSFPSSFLSISQRKAYFVRTLVLSNEKPCRTSAD